MLKKTEFHFIRHGETDWNFEGRCMGQTNISLNDTGIAQALKAGEALRGTPIQVICHSPLLRAKQTAELIKLTLKCPMIEIDMLKECGWGVLEGQLKENGKHLKKWLLGEVPEGAEEYQAFIKRAIVGINEALQYPAPLIVSHGGIYWGIQEAMGKKHMINSTGIQNGIPYYHKPPDNDNSLWSIEPIGAYHEESFEI